MDQRKNGRKTIASYISPRCFARGTRAALVALGYRVVAASTRGRFDDDSWQPDLRIIDARHLEKLPAEDYLPRIPVILLSDKPDKPCGDSRVVGTVPRPAGLADLYPLIQTALEEHPRRAARARTQLPARCTHADRRWMGAILSLSTGGCLFRTASDMPPGLELNLLFPLPRGRMVSTRAHVLRSYESDQVSMAFDNPPLPAQYAITEFVTTRLATARG